MVSRCNRGKSGITDLAFCGHGLKCPAYDSNCRTRNIYFLERHGSDFSFVGSYSEIDSSEAVIRDTLP